MDLGTVEANGLQFTYMSQGPRAGPLALCLHGFPDTAHTWRHLMPALADAGYRAVAPWLRGYAPTEVPSDGIYQTGAIAADACALHEVLAGNGDAVLIGHDWGALAAYCAAPYQPERWCKVVTMAVPPVAAAATAFFDYAQLKRSFYVFLFQTPLAEAAVMVDDFSFIDKLWADWSPRYDGSWDIPKVKESISSPANLAAAIGYYRAMFDASVHDPRYAEAQAASSSPPPQPTLYLHGTDDGAMGIEVTGDVLSFLSEGSEQVTVPSAGHFLHLEQPELVNEKVLGFLSS